MSQYPAPPQSGGPQPPYGAPPGPVNYGQPGYGQPRPSSGLAIGSLIAGIVSLLLFCCFWPAGLLAGGAALAMGFIARGKIARGEAGGGGMATAGIITGGIGLVLSLVIAGLSIFAGPEIQQKLRILQQQAEQQQRQQQNQGQ